MAEKYDDVLLPFMSLMRKELHANSRKGDRPGWLSMDANTLLLEVYWHTAKLSAAVKNNDGPAIMEHSADVANMAMMVLDACGGLAWVDACSSCGGTGSQGNGPGYGGCTDCLGTGVDPMSDTALGVPMPEGCAAEHPFSSRCCERGTKGCTVTHGVPASSNDQPKGGA